MTKTNHVLIDSEAAVFEDGYSQMADLPDVGQCEILRSRVYRGGRQDGVFAIRIDNGSFAFDVLPTRGMGVWRASSGEETLGWQSPIRGPVHPSFVPLSEPSGLGWLEGFDELLVRCGMESNGAPEFAENGQLKYPLHGPIANTPAHMVFAAFDDETGEISVTGVVEEARFHFHKLRLQSTVSTKVGERGFRVRDEVTNYSGVPGEFQMLYHVNFGVPLLDAGAKLVAPVKTVVPRNEHAASGIEKWSEYPAEQPGAEEQVYFFELVGDAERGTQVLLKNAQSTQGASLRFNKAELPHFTQWKNTVAAADGYVTGLEPGTNFPNPRSFEGEQGRVVKLDPGASHTMQLELRWHLQPEEVASTEESITALQGNVQPQVHAKPQPEWCAP